MKINDFTPAFEAAAPAIASQYVASYTSRINWLIEKVGLVNLRKLGNQWGNEAATYRAVRGFMVSKDWNYTGEINTVYLQKKADEYAAMVISSFIAKLNRKLGRLENVKVLNLDTCTFTIKGELDGQPVLVEQTMILKTSPKGNLFNQFPARIYVAGKFTSEAAFNKLAA